MILRSSDGLNGGHLSQGSALGAGASPGEEKTPDECRRAAVVEDGIKVAGYSFPATHEGDTEGEELECVEDALNASLFAHLIAAGGAW